jgi:UDP-2,3-diacylglucosamine pyrophosphatase LpxH
MACRWKRMCFTTACRKAWGVTSWRSAGIKQRLKSAREYIERFEYVAAQYALYRGFDGIVREHTHRPGIRSFGEILYDNDRDWVEHRTA